MMNYGKNRYVKPYLLEEQANAYSVSSGMSVTVPFVLPGSSSLTIQRGGALTIESDGLGRAIDMTGATTLALNNFGIVSIVGGTVLDGRLADGVFDLRVTNAAGAVMRGTATVLDGTSGSLGGTLLLDNAGLIDGADGAVNWKDIRATSVQIINRATGILLGAGDVLIPGNDRAAQVQIRNDGLILATGSGDGIDLQSSSGGLGANIVNGATGRIEAGRHGITGNNGIIVTNASGGIILGRNGSGLNFDTNERDSAVVVRNYGLISGNGSNPADSDGDGVDVDFTVDIRNGGRIEGTSADNILNFADGIAAGGGSIVNLVQGAIYGETNGILIDDSNLGPAPATTTIDNRGTISAILGAGIKLIGDTDDSVTNSGTISAQSGIAITMGGGNDTGSNTGLILGDVLLDAGADRFTNSGRIFGVVAGGEGNDRLVGLSGFNRFEGGAGDDALLGGSGVDRFSGGTGDDILSGGAGIDTLVGDEGQDRLDGGVGTDTLIGGAGDDLYISDGADSIVEDAGGGVDTVCLIGVGNLILDSAAVENVIVTDTGGGQVFGGAVVNRFVASVNAVEFYGAAGDDRLVGGAGDDLLSGGEGDDVLIGGAGRDIIDGRFSDSGQGGDRLIFDDGDFAGLGEFEADFIQTFDSNDILDLSRVDANIATAADDRFTYLGDRAFTGTPGELRLEQMASGNAMLFGDTDGDGLADFAITFEPAFGEVVALTASDFAL